ncbi:hypothetical protein [Pedobacter sp. MW01-1-1]|uniref:hypothetical protein n=1 Tax=Pedobacter sp. MW01-1-1 TaxID=3383027 RepID=UPI003FEEFE65
MTSEFNPPIWDSFTNLYEMDLMWAIRDIFASYNSFNVEIVVHFYYPDCFDYGQGGAAGGGSGSTSALRDTTMEADFYENLKAMCALSKLMNNDFYKRTLNNFIGSDKPIDLTFRLGYIAQDPGYVTTGNTVPNPRSWSATNIDLTIASNLIDSLPSISVALTLLHEGMHAEIYRKLLSIHGPNNLNAQNFPSLFNLWIRSREWEGVSHEFMANYYVNTIANALKEYDNSKFDIEYYKSYAWSGLKETDYFTNKIDSTFKANINSKTAKLLRNRNKQNCDDQ